MKTRTSILLVFRNAERFLPECLAGIGQQGAINLLSYDDGSTDNGCALVREFMLTGVNGDLIQKTEHLGKTAGIKVLEGKVETEFLCFVDADDIPLEGAIAKLEKALDKAPDACAAYTDAVHINEKSKITGPSPYNKYPWSWMNLYCGFMNPHLCLFRTSDYMAMGGVKADKECAATYDLKLRLGANGKKFVKVPKVLVKRRIHPGQISVANRETQVSCANASREAVSEYLKKLVSAGEHPFNG